MPAIAKLTVKHKGPPDPEKLCTARLHMSNMSTDTAMKHNTCVQKHFSTAGVL